MLSEMSSLTCEYQRSLKSVFLNLEDLRNSVEMEIFQTFGLKNLVRHGEIKELIR